MNLDLNKMKNPWSYPGLFMIWLIMMLPFYSADVLAVTVQVTSNHGSAGVEGFIDGLGDAWSVEANIMGHLEASIDPSKVNMKIGSKEIPFSSCSATELGSSCSYQDDLSGGLGEGSYTFQVAYSYLDEQLQDQTVLSPPYKINSDQTGPVVVDYQISQEEKGVSIYFIAKDDGTPSVGLKKIEVIDWDSKQVLDTIDENSAGFENGMKEYEYFKTIPLSLKGEGRKKIRVMVEDSLGHESKSSVKSFKYDFAGPQIKTNTFEFPNSGRFVGSSEVISSMSILIKEVNDLVKVTATSEDVELSHSDGNCKLQEEDNWRCSWINVKFSPQASVSVSFTAKDEFGNEVTAGAGTKFTTDDDVPTVEYFGSEKQYNDLNYASRTGKSRIILKVKDQGAGIDKNGISLRLPFTSITGPTCENASSGLECYWDVSRPKDNSRVTVSMDKFVDKVGNEGEKQSLDFIVDDNGPKIEKVEIFGLSDIGDKKYFQSRDSISIQMTIQEESGLNFMVDLNDLVNDAQNDYEELGGSFSSLGAGWRTFTHDDCEKKDARWVCKLETEAIKSGPDNTAKLNIKVLDTAGNEAVWLANPKNVQGTEGKFKFKLLGLDEELDPDLWRDTSAKALLPFVDLDVVGLIPTRMPVKVTLTKNVSNAKLMRIDLPSGACKAEEGAPPLKRGLLVGGVSPGGVEVGTPTILLELDTFDGRSHFGVGTEESFYKKTAKYTCTLLLYSTVGREALQYPEKEDVILEIPFGFSTQGSIDENLGKKITDIRESGFFKFASVMSDIESVIKWIDWAAGLTSLITSVITLITIFEGKMKASSDPLEGPVAHIGAVLKGGCFTIDTSSSEILKIVEYVQIPLQVLSCKPNAWMTTQESGKTVASSASGVDALGWYGKYQSSVLKIYNYWTGRTAMGIPADSLYDNMYLSMIGLCVRGLTYNVDKAREIHCRKIICYGQEVPAGIATVDSCDKLYDVLMCEFVFGPLADFIPFASFVELLGSIVQSAISSPVGVIVTVAESLTCGLLCFSEEKDGGALLTACKVVKVTTILMDMVDSVVSAATASPSVTGSPYCKVADEIDVSTLTGHKGEQVIEEEQGVEQGAPVQSSESGETTAPPQVADASVGAS